MSSKNDTVTSKRLDYIDNITAVMLLIIIFGHACQWTGDKLCFDKTNDFIRLVFPVFMPWFFFKGGLFFTKKGIADNLRKTFRRLVLPFAVFGFAGHIIYCIWLYIEGGTLSVRSVFIEPLYQIACYGSNEGNAPLWFLFSFFLVHNIHNVISNYITNEVVVILIYLLAGCVFFIVGFDRPWYVGNTLSGLLFFSSAAYSRKFIMPFEIKERYSKITLAILVCSFVFETYIYRSNVIMRNNDLSCGNPCLWLVMSCLVCMFYVVLFQFIPLRLKYLAHIGRTSMVFYVYHWLFFMMYKMIFDFIRPDLSSTVLCLIYFFGSMIPCYYISKRSRFV